MSVYGQVGIYKDGQDVLDIISASPAGSIESSLPTLAASESELSSGAGWFTITLITSPLAKLARFAVEMMLRVKEISSSQLLIVGELGSVLVCRCHATILRRLVDFQPHWHWRLGHDLLTIMLDA